MQTYIGTKLIKASEILLGDYNLYRGWDMPEDEDPNAPGYLVEYIDGGKANHNNHEGYISWSPKDVFEKSYKPTLGMSFGLAIEALRLGFKVGRKGWNGKGMFLVLVNGTPSVELREGTPYQTALNSGDYGQSHVSINSHIDMFTAQGEMQPGWSASQTDMLAFDWEIVE
jgi:GMP synthase-like glutamine amidotransferase